MTGLTTFQSPIKRRPLLPLQRQGIGLNAVLSFNRLSSGVLFYPIESVVLEIRELEAFQSPIKRRPLLPGRGKTRGPNRSVGFNRLSSGVLFYPAETSSPTKVHCEVSIAYQAASSFTLSKHMSKELDKLKFQSPIKRRPLLPLTKVRS